MSALPQGNTRLFDRLFLSLMALMVVIVATTAGDYGISVDEFLFDVYGVKSLQYYATFGADRSSLDWYDDYLYGPWFHIIVAWLQSFNWLPTFEMRHLATGMLSLVGLVGTFLLGRMVFNARVGFTAVCLLLLTGNYYGHMFNSPVDAPFTVAMTWATLAIVAVFAGNGRRLWLKAAACGFLIGLSVASRVGGLMLPLYVAGGAILLVLAYVLPKFTWSIKQADPSLPTPLATSALALGVMVVAALSTWCLWPWIQDDPLGTLSLALGHFGKRMLDYSSVVWGIPFRTIDLPWYYIPLNFIARLAEPFTVFLGLALIRMLYLAGLGLAKSIDRRDRLPDIVFNLTTTVVENRGAVILATAGLFPLVYIVISGAIIYDGIRHILFVVPLLALLAGWAAEILWKRLACWPVPSAVLGGAVIGYGLWAIFVLHPNEYIRITAFAGGTKVGAPLFETDYWANGTAEAVDRLKDYLDFEAANGREVKEPRVLVKIAYREFIADAMMPKHWKNVGTTQEAQFAIAPTRWDWEMPKGARLIARISRQGVTLANVYDIRRQ